ncbi:hypothetical protein ACWKWU_16855 [Chitinophaga lutea]
MEIQVGRPPSGSQDPCQQNDGQHADSDARELFPDLVVCILINLTEHDG